MALLRIAAFFELFDGLQIVATGALRGIGDTRSPMIAHAIGYWVIGMPVVYVLGFPMGWGARGIWIGRARPIRARVDRIGNGVAVAIGDRHRLREPGERAVDGGWLARARRVRAAVAAEHRRRVRLVEQRFDAS